MASQFDLYRLPNGGLVVVLQNDLLDQIQTRVVAPLVSATVFEQVMQSRNPTITLGEESYVFMPQLAATLTMGELGEKVGSLDIVRDTIVRALDALLSGVCSELGRAVNTRLRIIPLTQRQLRQMALFHLALTVAAKAIGLHLT